MTETQFTVTPVGVIRSDLIDLASAPKQGDEGNYEARLELDPAFAGGLQGINVGDELILLTWLHLGQRDELQTHPRNNPDAPLTGVFATRSPNRPNPIGLHEVTVLEIDGSTLRVGPLEAVDGTPVIDIKPVLLSVDQR
jgi:tRNA-Thr(GGU) m(6)t(6)A37 methyltransferase TsaA